MNLHLNLGDIESGSFALGIVVILSVSSACVDQKPRADLAYCVREYCFSVKWRRRYLR